MREDLWHTIHKLLDNPACKIFTRPPLNLEKCEL